MVHEKPSAGGGKSGKRKWGDSRILHGSARVGRHNGRAARGGRNRSRNEEPPHKRQKEDEDGEGDDRDDSTPQAMFPNPFTAEEIAAEPRRPKHKCAVMIGYSGTGYRGLQISATERTIEGDLFKALVAAGAISKANADNPRKSTWTRCSRTDKGVHAAGNVMSAKLIIEDEDIIERINSHLSPQIRVWGVQRTTGAFNSYQACDSRWYEYLIPTFSFLPPHPRSALAIRLKRIAEEQNDLEGYENRQTEVSSWWDQTHKVHIEPVMDRLEPHIKSLVSKALFDDKEKLEMTENARTGEAQSNVPEESDEDESGRSEDQAHEDSYLSEDSDITQLPAEKPLTSNLADQKRLDSAVRELKKAVYTAQRAYRIDRARLERVRTCLSQFIGSHNFHNYTVQKRHDDPSAIRHIKTFEINNEPVLASSSDPADGTTALAEASDVRIINGTEWLSLKIHGQSFMMHQIRKMIGMIALVVRTGCPPERIADTFSSSKVGIPKAPALGLLLERPVFGSYNEKLADKFGRETVTFDKYQTEMLEFKQREIYERIYREELEQDAFRAFFTNVDRFKEKDHLYLSSGGIEATDGWQETRVGTRSRIGQRRNKRSKSRSRSASPYDKRVKSGTRTSVAG